MTWSNIIIIDMGSVGSSHSDTTWDIDTPAYDNITYFIYTVLKPFYYIVNIDNGCDVIMMLMQCIYLRLRH